jgi:hypothetical protein
MERRLCGCEFGERILVRLLCTAAPLRVPAKPRVGEMVPHADRRGDVVGDRRGELELVCALASCHAHEPQPVLDVRLGLGEARGVGYATASEGVYGEGD